LLLLLLLLMLDFTAAAAADFRLDCDSMAASGQLRLLAQEVLKRVTRSGQQAIIIAHSHGATVALQLLQEPAL
jgi:hypothetical protein